MNRFVTVGLAMVAGAALGAAAMNGLHAQGGLPAFSVTELEVTNVAGYEPIRTTLTAENQKAGGKFLAQGGRVEMVEGTAPKRVIITQWKSMDDAKKYYATPAVKKAFEDRKQFTRGARIFIVEGMPAN